jgi:cobalt-zinc-cadmium efflux system membrane fusion protein
LHDRSYVFLPGSGDGNFRRVQVKLGQSLPGNMVEIQGTVSAGQQVVANALDLQNTADQE